jgi:hypothetical protein
VFGLTYGRTRGATWFDTTRPPQGIVWLLDAQIHDERHKGSADAYDLFAQLEAAGALFPVDIDYTWLELDRRLRDTASFAEDVRRDAIVLVGQARRTGRADGRLAGVPARLAWVHPPNDLPVLYVAISTRPIIGARSGLEFPLNGQRFLLLAEAVRQAGEELVGPEVLVDQLRAAPDVLGRRQDERAFFVIFERG